MTTTNLTIGDAAFLIIEKYGFDFETREALLDRLQEAAHMGGLVVRDPLTGLPYRPVHNKGLHYYLMDIVSTEDLNAWLEKQGVEYRLDSPEQLSISGASAPTNAKTKMGLRIDAIIKKATFLDYPLLCIPYGGKAAIERQCLNEDPRLFTHDTFKTAWKEAKHRELIQVDNVEQYRYKKTTRRPA